MTRTDKSTYELRPAGVPRGRKARSARAQSGLTLVELMISMVIVSIAVAAAFALGFSMVSSYRDHRRLMEVERTARVSMEIIADTIRLASAGVPTGDLKDLVGCSAFGALRVDNATNGPDQLEVIHASGGVLTALRSAYKPDDTQIDVFVDEAFDGDELDAGDYIIITDGTMGHFRKIQSVGAFSAGTNVILELEPVPPACGSVDFPAAGFFAPGSFVIRAQSTRFSIADSIDTGNVPTLMMDPDGDGPEEAVPVAQGVEDMQIAVGIDMDDDGALAEEPSTTDEWYYNVPGDLDAPLITDDPPRALRVTLVARSLNETSSQAASSRPAAEDHAEASYSDVFRRRVLSTVLEIRNLEGSPP